MNMTQNDSRTMGGETHVNRCGLLCNRKAMITQESAREVETKIRYLRENKSFLASEEQVLIDSYARIALNVVADD